MLVRAALAMVLKGKPVAVRSAHCVDIGHDILLPLPTPSGFPCKVTCKLFLGSSWTELPRGEEEPAKADQHRDTNGQPQMKGASLNIDDAVCVFEGGEQRELPGRKCSQGR